MMTGLITLSNSILCKKEVLGLSFDCEIEGIKLRLCFPQYPVVDESSPIIGISNPLLPPEIGATWKREGESLYWGCPMSHPAGNSCVELLAVSVVCDKESVSDYTRTLYESLQKWEHAFIDYLRLETKQGPQRNQNKQRNSCSLELMDDGGYIPDNKTVTLYGVFPDTDSFASESDIMSAISFADSGKELLLEYQMLLSSYEARRQNQNRRAILDACTAMEITLVNQINHYCHSIGLHPDILTNKYRSLGDRIELLREIGVSFPNRDYKKMVVKPRNDVMHNREIYPSDETIDKLITCVEAFLGHFHTTYY